MTKEHYRIFGIVFTLLAILQLPFIHAMPSVEQATSFVESFGSDSDDKVKLEKNVYNEFMFYWQLPITTIVLLSLSSIFAYKCKKIFSIFFASAVFYYVLVYDYKLILESPKSLSLLLTVNTNTSYQIMYDIIINYLLLPIMYILLPLLYIWFLTTRPEVDSKS